MVDCSLGGGFGAGGSHGERRLANLQERIKMNVTISSKTENLWCPSRDRGSGSVKTSRAGKRRRGGSNGLRSRCRTGNQPSERRCNLSRTAWVMPSALRGTTTRWPPGADCRPSPSSFWDRTPRGNPRPRTGPRRAVSAFRTANAPAGGVNASAGAFYGSYFPV